MDTPYTICGTSDDNNRDHDMSIANDMKTKFSFSCDAFKSGMYFHSIVCL